MLHSKIIKKRIKSPFKNYVNFKSVLVPKDNEKQNSDGSYMNKYKNMLLAVLVINKYILMINLVNLSSHT